MSQNLASFEEVRELPVACAQMIDPDRGIDRKRGASVGAEAAPSTWICAATSRRQSASALAFDQSLEGLSYRAESFTPVKS